MRLAMAILADAANIREGMLNVLSAGVSEMWRKDFPAPFGAVLPLLIELDEKDDFEVLVVEAHLMHRGDDGRDEQIGVMSGQIKRQGEPGPTTNVPSVLGWGDVMLPGPGEYYVRVNVGGVVWTDVPFRVHQLRREARLHFSAGLGGRSGTFSHEDVVVA